MASSRAVDEPLTEWLVAFVDHGDRHWWCRLLKPGFRHCFAMGFDPRSRSWVLLDLKLDGVVARPLTPDAADRLIAVVKAAGRFLRCRVEFREPPTPRPWLTCVSLVEHLLGVRGCAVTPWRLYRRLIARGAQPWPGE